MKDKIWKKFIESNLHQKIIKAAYIIESDPNKYDLNGRFHEKWINAFNIFLGYDWGEIESWIVDLPSDLSLATLFLKLFLSTN